MSYMFSSITDVEIPFHDKLVFAISEHLYTLANSRHLMRKAKNVFEPKASRVLRCLLTHPGEAWTIRGIADEVKVSVGYTHAVLIALLEWGYVIRNEYNRVEVINPIKLLERWGSYHQFLYENDFEEYYCFESNVEEILNRLVKVASQYALTTLSGAYIVSPYVRPNVVEMYVRDDQREPVVKGLELRPAAGGGNVLLVRPYDEGVFYESQDVDGLKVVSDVQLYVDLINYPSRGEDAAERVLEKIRDVWSDYLLG